MTDTQSRATILGSKLNTLSNNIGIFAADLEKDIDTILGTVDKDIVAAQTHVNNCQRELDELQKTVSTSSFSSSLLCSYLDLVARQLLHVSLRIGWKHRWGSHPRMCRRPRVC
jgi:hypothetical protein